MRRHQLRDERRTRDVSAFCLGTMYFGTTVAPTAAFQILDRFTERGGTFIDTANCYAFWAGSGTGSESETLLGEWLQRRGRHDDLTIATKVGAGPRHPALPYDAHNREGLSRDVIRGEIVGSLSRLGVDQVDVLYAHADDRHTPLEESLGVMGELVDEGLVGMVAASNYTAWRLALARDLSDRLDLPRPAAIQLRHTFLDPRPMREPVTDQIQLPVTPDVLDYQRAYPDLTVLGYSPLLGGAYVRADRPVPPVYDHAGTRERLALLHVMADDLDATANQVVLAWLLASDPPILPVIGVSSLAQLDDCLDAGRLLDEPDTVKALSTFDDQS